MINANLIAVIGVGTTVAMAIGTAVVLGGSYTFLYFKYLSGHKRSMRGGRVNRYARNPNVSRYKENDLQATVTKIDTTKPKPIDPSKTEGIISER
jgi:hypothetical protein